MQDFLSQVLTDLDTTRLTLSNYTLIVPSRRVGTFLKNKIANSNSAPTFAPTILTVEEFIAQLSGLSIVTDLEILQQFYSAYLSVERENPDSFDEFITWAPTILQDFNEIDRYLVPTDSFFTYLGNVKELDPRHWSLEENPTQMVSKYLRFWQRLQLYYDALSKVCTQNHIAYQGLAYRTAFAKAESHIQLPQFENLVFIGLNALNTAESRIIQLFLQNTSTKIYWDADAYFMESTYHEAGKYFRKFKNEWNYFEKKEFSFINDNYAQPKSIEIASATGQLGMIQTAVQSLSLKDLENTVIVLADESLLQPLLSALQQEIEKINVTMGLDLAKTPLAQFIISFMTLHEQRHDKGFYYKDILRFLESPYGKIVTPHAPNYSQQIRRENIIYLENNILDLDKDFLFKDLLKPLDSPSHLIDRCKLLLKILKEAFKKTANNKLLIEQLYGLHEVHNQLENILHQFPLIQDVRTVMQLFKQFLSMKKLDLYGSASTGLQVMGLLETRALDFKNVILIGLNEGILPAGKTASSYIPIDLKIEHNMPTYSDKDSVYAYHFYRLLHRVQQAQIIYNNEVGNLGAGERSRFILQLLTDRIPDHDITTRTYQFDNKSTSTDLLSVTKNEVFKQRLVALNESGFSPSSLTTYVRNPLDFLQRSIYKIRDRDEVEEDIALNTMGSIIHEALDNIYKPYQGKVLTIDHLSQMKKKVITELDAAYRNVYESPYAPSGKNKIIYEVASHYIYKMLAADRDMVTSGLELKLLHTELDLKGEINITALGKINLKGHVDRVDMIDGTLRIIDYKSGGCNKGDVGLENDAFNMLIQDYSKAKAFQVLMYTYLFKQRFPETDSCMAGIVSFKDFNSGFIPFSIKSGRSYEPTLVDVHILERFEEQLEAMLLEIYDLKIPLLEKEV